MSVSGEEEVAHVSYMCGSCRGPVGSLQSLALCISVKGNKGLIWRRASGPRRGLVDSHVFHIISDGELESCSTYKVYVRSPYASFDKLLVVILCRNYGGKIVDYWR